MQLLRKLTEPESHATNQHQVIADTKASRLGGFQHARAVDGLQIEAAQSLRTPICCRYEANGRIVESDLGMAGVARADRAIEHVAPAGGERGRVAGLDLGGDHGLDYVQASSWRPIRTGGVPRRVDVVRAVVLT